MTPPDLEAQARAFANETSELLNNTIAVGQRLSAFLTAAGTCVIGRGVTRSNVIPERIPLAVRPKAKPRCFLAVTQTFTLDPEGVWLTTDRSAFGLYRTDDPDEDALLRYEYEREPDNAYPEAHLHIGRIESEDFEALLVDAGRPEDSVSKLHFPVGGRRFRISLEDVIEFLAVEELVETHDGWRDVVESHREEWERRQIRAAVRRHPDWAREALDDR